jgi:hypoxanthine phosphoribosyltransferase
VEDIVDSGHSISQAMAFLMTCQPASIRLCALLDKPARRQVPVEIDYLGLTVQDQFVVGYGMDWNEKYRELPDIQMLRFAQTSLQSG